MKNREKRQKTSSKKLIISVIVAFAVCIGVFAFASFAQVNGLFDHVTGLTLTQDGDSIIAEWDDLRVKGYRVTVQAEDGRAGRVMTDTNRFVIEKIEYNKEYTVRVQTRYELDLNTPASEEKIYTLRPQKIETAVDSCKGFAMERFSLNAKAKGELTYSSTNEKVAAVDETGEVYMTKPGTAIIKVKAAKTDDCSKAVKDIPVTVCPDQLGAITIEKEYDSDTSVTLKWNEVPFAEEYILKRYSAHDDKYKKVKTFDADETSVKMAREAGKYKIEARVDVHGTVLSSKSEESVKVKAVSEDFKSYGSIHIIGTIGANDVETVTTIGGAGKVNNPQSMCCTKDGYVVAFVSKSNSAGMLKAYSRKGKLVSSRHVGGMKHANGCTYNPYADRIYVCPTYAGHKDRSLLAFDAETLESTGSIGLHNAPSGAAYDDTNNCYYMSASWRLYVTDSDFNVIKVIKRLRHERSQDMGAYNGVALSCIWKGGRNSYIDMYRASDSAYIGSYSVPLGEIESACIDDGHLVLLINKGTDVIYRTKDRIKL